MTGFNFNFNFGGSSNNAAAEKDESKQHFQISEQMLLSELPNDIASEFVDVYKTIQNTTSEMSQTAAKTSTCENQSDVQKLKQETTAAIVGSLSSLAHQIDIGQSTFHELKAEHELAKLDLDSYSHFRGAPSPFIKRYFAKIQKFADDLAQSLSSYSNRCQSRTNDARNDGEAMLNSMLNEQHSAILRCSSRVAALVEKMDRVEAEISNRMKGGITHQKSEDSQNDNCSRMLQESWKRFQNNQKRKLYKIADESDLFGNSATQAQNQSSSGFSFGSGFNFGSTNSSFSNTGFAKSGNTATTFGQKK